MAGKRLKIPIIKETLLDIPTIEETSKGNYSKFGLVTTANLEGRPTRVLKRFIDTGIERHWWNKKSFEKIVELCWGKDFMEDLKAMDKRRVEENKNGNKIR